MKKIFSISLLIFIILLSASCNNIPHETSQNLSSETTETVQTTETTELKIGTLIPKNYPQNIYLYHFDCKPLPENIDPSEIKLSLEKSVYSTQDTEFRIDILNESSEPIEVYNTIFLEKYESNGTDFYGQDYFPGWKRIPFDSSSYLSFQLPKNRILPSNTSTLKFYTKHNDKNCLLENDTLSAGRYRFAIYMSGGVRYLEFEITE